MTEENSTTEGFYIQSKEEIRINNNRGKWLTNKIVMSDETGYKITFDLQSVQTGTGPNYETETGPTFDGYLVGVVNIEDREVILGEDGRIINIIEDQQGRKRLNAKAEAYISAHPEEVKARKDIPTAFSNPESIHYDPTAVYIKLMIKKAIEADIKAGKATPLEKAYIYQVDNGKFLSFEQLTGETALDDDEKSLQDIENDEVAKSLTREFEEFDKSAQRGEKSLRERMKKDSEKTKDIKITVGKGDKRQTMTFSREDKPIEEQTFNEDEKNALVKKAIERLTSKDK